MKYLGLIPGKQKNVGDQEYGWDYGRMTLDGKKYIDPMLNFGCYTLGYGQMEIMNYVHNNMCIKPEIAENFFDTQPIELNNATFKLAKTLRAITSTTTTCTDCGDGRKIPVKYRSIFALSGSDAVEGAVKLASAYQQEVGSPQRNKIVVFRDSYHGSTLLTQSMGDGLFGDPFYTMSPCENIMRLPIEFVVDNHNWDDVMCVVVETCPYVRGIRPHTEEFWKKIRDIQDRGVLVIVDDIFTGGGKTGTFVGWKRLPVAPDIFTMGKAITGGYFPLSITLYNDKIHNALPREFDWEHGFTYSFSLPGILSCLAYIKILKDDNLMDKHRDIVVRAVDLFKALGYNVRGQFGTIIEIEREHKGMYTIPINANDEYFYFLEQQLK